jgi:hypothetical protein
MKPIHTAVTLCSAILLCSTAAQATPLTGTMLINAGDLNAASVGSYFAMGANNPYGNAAMLTPGSAGGIVLGTYQNFVLDPDVPHPANWDGLGGKPGTGYGQLPDTESTLLASFAFFGTPTFAGTNPIAYQSGEAHAAPTADISNCVGNTCTLSVDLSSWEVMWNGSAFEQGPRPANNGPFVPAVGTYDLATAAYALTWASQIKGGPFNGVIGYWHLEGTVCPVPLPAAAWLLGSGLLGLVGVGRCRQTAA